MKRFTLFLSSLFLFSCSESNTKELGLQNNQLKELDDKPHGVSTMTKQDEKKMDPIVYQASHERAKKIIKESLIDFGSTEIISETNTYMHVEFSTTLGFTDDVEFFLDTLEKKIHFRSESRIGYSDLGTNRSRMTKLTTYIKENL